MRLISFIETPLFECLLAEYLADDEYIELQKFLAANPEYGKVIQGAGGCRKIRWPNQKRGKGKRGGIRIIYYYFEDDGIIYLISIYHKAEKSDLTAAEKKAISALAKEIKGE